MDKEFVVEDYKLRISYLNAHFNRMWTRFNFFLTLQSGLIAFFFVGTNQTLSENAPLFLVVQFLLSLIWWVFGAQDRWLVKAYRADIEAIKDEIIAVELAPKGYMAVGDYTGRDFGSIRKNPVQWYGSRTSITRLAAYVPLLLLFAWLCMIAWYTWDSGINVVWTYAALTGALVALLLIVRSLVASDGKGN